MGSFHQGAHVSNEYLPKTGSRVRKGQDETQPSETEFAMREITSYASDPTSDCVSEYHAAAAAAAEAAEAALDVEAAAEATKVRRDSQYRAASTPSWFKRLTGESVG